MEESVINGKGLWNAEGGRGGQERRQAGQSRVAHRAMMTATAIMAAVGLMGAVASPISAQSYPTKPIRFILPMAPGGGVDIVGRKIAPMLAERLGQAVVPENRPGGGGNVGLEYVAKARPLSFCVVGIHVNKGIMDENPGGTIPPPKREPSCFLFLKLTLIGLLKLGP